MAVVHDQRTEVIRRLVDEVDQLADSIAKQLEADHLRLAAIDDPGFHLRLVESNRAAILAFARWAARGDLTLADDELAYYRERATRAAEHLLPLDALQEPIRCGVRIIWRWLVDAAGDTAAGRETSLALVEDLVWFSGELDRAVTRSYVEARFQRRSDERQYHRDIVEELLAGRHLADEAVTHLAAAFRLSPGTPCHVAVGRPVADSGLPSTLTGVVEIVDLLEQGTPGAWPLIVDRGDELVGIFAARRPVAEMVANAHLLLDRLERVYGVELWVGFSTAGRLRDAPDRYAEASVALRFGHERRQRVVALPDVRVFDYVARRSDGTARRLAPTALPALRHEDERSGGALVATLVALADCDLNVGRTAEQLFVHPNTVHYRLRRIAEITGMEPKRFRDLADLLVGLHTTNGHQLG